MSNFKSLVGLKIGKLLILEEFKDTRWKVHCG